MNNNILFIFTTILIISQFLILPTYQDCDEGIGGLCWEDDDCCQGKCRNNKCCYLNKRGLVYRYII
ncbi:hypothetical protein Mgra_00010115 [Meloidogyne graminicola]|uniref:Uncharacterized protein n=1 Tax=Meloidogyne graminicola TaxID=189291 RepID=A0A8S9ZD28_9BILA|nr:hypothetical protein Mgra_00010115 [Meloidogyne graminicola]